MRYRYFDGRKLSALILGTNKYGSDISDVEAFSLMDKYMELGGNMLDTAEVYGDWNPAAGKSASEKCIGRWLRSNPGIRGQLWLATKGGHYRWNDSERKSRVRPECIKEDIESSLSNLGTDAVDLYWLHKDDISCPVEELMDALFECRAMGYVRRIGASNWTRERIDQANRYAVSCSQEGFIADQLRLSYIQPRGNSADEVILQSVGETAQKHFRCESMPVFAYRSQAQGYITKILGGRPLSETMRSTYDCPLNRRRALRAAAVAEKLGVSAEAVGLCYLYSMPFPVFPIVGPRTAAQLCDSAKAVDIDIPDSYLEFLSNDAMTAAAGWPQT